MLYLDTETYNATKDISAGIYEYARTVEISLIAYGFDDHPIQLWDLTKTSDFPRDLHHYLYETSEPITAHNAMFDRQVIIKFFKEKPEIDITRWRCTLAKAYAHGFLGSLDSLSKILGLSNAKHPQGKQLINRFCKPAPRSHKVDRYDHKTHPKEWAEFCAYAISDVEALRELDKTLPDWNYKGSELDLYHLDQRINDRGFFVDREFVTASVQLADNEKLSLTRRFSELTGGMLTAPSQREKFRNYLNDSYRLDLKDNQSTTLKALLENQKQVMDPKLRELLEISVSFNKSSTAKYATLAQSLSPDSRFRGGLQYAGAARTRRWAGRTFQPHNLPSRSSMPVQHIDCYIDALKLGVHDLLFDDIVSLASASLRGVLTASPKHHLYVADLSNIEGRVNAWLAGEKWKLKAFRDFDQGSGHDLYKITAGLIVGKTPDKVSKTERNVLGKVPELALGYEGGVGAFQTFSRAYGVTMADHWGNIQASLADKFIAQAQDNYANWGREKSELPKIEWLACEAVKLGWRDRHLAIASLWKIVKDAAIQAVQNPTRIFKAGLHLKLRCLEHSGFRYLLMRLPSGNFLVYFDPKIDAQNKLTYMGINALTRKWERIASYGGKLVENACQSLSRDILATNMPKIEQAGFKIVLTVHDEIVAEAPVKENLHAKDLSELMAFSPSWAKGLPLAATGFESNRYRKE